MTPAPRLVTQVGLAEIQSALREMGVDGWLLYEFRGQNWIAQRLLGVEHTTRRAFVLVPAEGGPVALIHAIEGSHWRHWPHERRSYAGWEELERELAMLVRRAGGGAGDGDGDGAPDVAHERVRLAMEVSPGDAVPTVDLVPSGVAEMVRDAGVDPVGSGDLVTRFFSVWTDDQLEAHRRAAEVVASVARDAFDTAADAVREEEALTEGALSEWIRKALKDRGVTVDADTHVAVGAGAADPHYAPDGEGETIRRGQLLLIDLWGRTSEAAVCADQTWMGMLDDHVPDRVHTVWEIVRAARDAAVAFLRERHEAGEPVRGWEVDHVARRVIEDAGHGEHFIHRTGHSMDTKLHGSGPNLDNLETRDERLLVEGVGFSIEPGIYLPGEFGVRSEINVHYGPDGPEVTPREIQDEVFVLLGGSGGASAGAGSRG